MRTDIMVCECWSGIFNDPQKGADGDGVDMHEQNIQTLEEYIEVLENLKSDVIS